MIMSLCYDDRNCDFIHDDELQLPAWYDHKVVTWRKCNNMRDSYQIMYQATDASWAKNTRMRKQGVKEAQINGCVPDEVTQQTGHIKKSFSNACCTYMDQNMLHASSGFNVQKDVYDVLRYNINLNDEEHPLAENTTLSKMDIARRLMPKMMSVATNVNEIQ